MSSSNLAWLRIAGVAIALCSLAFTSCNYDVPITSGPTRKVEQRLLGDWISLDGKENMKVRRLDDNTYVVYYDGDLFRAYHLRLRSVNDKVVPKETKDSAGVVALLTKNARNPELFGEEIEFKKEK
jgi:hypothetical protein